jgi:hypothetical protein
MTRPIRDLDMPLPALEQQIRDLVARQRKAVAEMPPGRHLAHLTHPATTTPEEAP